MKAITEETLSERIARILADRIISGEIPAGARLRQDHVAAQFDASHVPVREAFRALQERGLAKSEPRRGFRVTDFDVAELREVSEMRASLEALALRHSAPNLTRKILKEAEEVNQKGDGAANVREWEAANREFHRLILAPCQMPRLLQTIEDLQIANARFLFAAWQRDWETRTNYDHRYIIAALRDGQTDLACSTLARHVGWMSKRKPSAKNGLETGSYEIPG